MLGKEPGRDLVGGPDQAAFVGAFGEHADYLIGDVVREPEGENSLSCGTDKALADFITRAHDDLPKLSAELRTLRAGHRAVEAELVRANTELARRRGAGPTA